MTSGYEDGMKEIERKNALKIALDTLNEAIKIQQFISDALKNQQITLMMEDPIVIDLAKASGDLLIELLKGVDDPKSIAAIQRHLHKKSSNDNPKV